MNLVRYVNGTTGTPFSTSFVHGQVTAIEDSMVCVYFLTYFTLRHLLVNHDFAINFKLVQAPGSPSHLDPVETDQLLRKY